MRGLATGSIGITKTPPLTPPSSLEGEVSEDAANEPLCRFDIQRFRQLIAKRIKAIANL